MSTPHHARGVALMLASAACFTANVLLVRALGQSESVSVWVLSAARFVVGLAVIYAFYRRAFEPSHLFRNPKLISRGLIGGATVYAYYFTIVHLGAGRATFINNTYVIFGALLAVWILGERFRWNLAIGSAAALAGLALLTNIFAAPIRANPYYALAILTALGSAYVVVTIRQLHATEHTATIFGAQCVYGLLACIVPAILNFASHSSLSWVLILLAGVVSAGGQIAMTASFRILPVAEGSLLQMLVPLGIAGGGVLFFRERFALHDLLGAALILAGTGFTALRR
ncbi:MAG: DMT family transporter [Opitutaceae bacterium]